MKSSVVIAFLLAALAVAAPAIGCQLQYTGPAARMFGSTPRGHFSDATACDHYRLSRPAFEANNSQCVGCSGSGSSYGGGFSGGSFPQQMMYGLIQSFMNGFMQGLRQPARPQGPSQADIARQQKIQAQLRAEWQAKVKKQINEMQRSYAEQKRQEFAQRKSALLADLMPPEGLPSHSRALQQACMISLQLKAAKALARGDDQLFGRYRRLYDQVEAGDLSACQASLPHLPEPTPALADKDLNQEFRAAFSQTVLSEINMRLPLIHQAREEKGKAHARVQELESKVEAVRAKPAQTANSGDSGKPATDDLLAQALKELEKAKKLERKADEDLERLSRELEALEEVKTAAAAGHKSADGAKP